MIVVTGGSGMVGTALRERLGEGVYLCSDDVDLRDGVATRETFGRLWKEETIETVVHLAGRVGGIKDNAEHPYDYFRDNVLINTNVIDVCVALKIGKLLALSSTCVYPKDADRYPLDETMVHDGMPEETNRSYGYAKRMMQVQIDAAREQFGLDAVVLYPSNLYGPGDHFDLQRGHLVPALIRKMHEAKAAGRDSISLLGTGKPLRQFTFVDDLAKVIAACLEREGLSGDFNFATPENLSVRDIAATVAEVVGYRGRLDFQGDLDGQFRKDVTSDRLEAVFGKFDFTPLAKGAAATYAWYQQMENQSGEPKRG